MSARPVRGAIAWSVFPLIALGVLSCGDEPVATLEPMQLFGGADGVTIDGSGNFTNVEGIRRAYLTFDTMYSWNDSADYEIRGVDLFIYNESDGSERARVVAREGTVDEGFEALTARREVVALIPSEGRRLETERLEYDPRREEIRSDTCFVMFVNDDEVSRGTAFVSDLEFRNFRLENDPERAEECGS